MLNMTGMMPVNLEWYIEMKPKGQRKGRMDFATWATAADKTEAARLALKEAELNGFRDYQIAKISEVK